MARDRARLRRRAVIGAVAGVLALGVVLVIALGGLDEDEGRAVESYSLGDRIEVGDFVTVVDAVTVSRYRLGTESEASAGRLWLTVTATQTNLTDAPMFLGRARIGVNYGSALTQATETTTVDRALGGAAAAPLQPGVATRLLYVFEIPDDIDATDAVIGVYRTDRVYGDPVFGDTSYGSPYPVGRIAVDEIERRA